MAKKQFPNPNQSAPYIQTNRSDTLGSFWSTFNIELQNNLGDVRLGNKLVQVSNSVDDVDLGCPTSFVFWQSDWWCVAGAYIYQGSDNFDNSFSKSTVRFSIGTSTTQFDITKSVNTVRYTYDGTGTNPGINATSMPINSTVYINGTNFNAANNGTFTVTGSGSNYFEVTNASGVVESNKTIGSGVLAISGNSNYETFDGADLALFNERLWVLGEDSLWSTDNTQYWTKRDSVSASGGSVLLYFPKRNQLYYFDGSNGVSSTDISDVIYNSPTTQPNCITILTGTYGEKVGMVCTSNYIYIYTFLPDNSASASGTGYILEWDGVSDQFNNIYTLQSSGVLSMTVYEDIPYAVDGFGRILRYTGSSFTEVARLPVQTLLPFSSSVSGDPGERFIFRNGMIPTKNNTLLLNINAISQRGGYPLYENFQSGVWEVDLSNGNCTHKTSYTYQDDDSSTITDFGQQSLYSVGAIVLNTLNDTGDENCQFACGATVYTDATATQSSIYRDAPMMEYGQTSLEGQKRGYFTTTWFESDEVEDKWSRLWTVYKRFVTSTDKIIAKYRLYEEDPIYANITWVNTTSFTTTTDITAYAQTATGFNGTVGGEVEIVQGTGGGACVHITNVVNNAGTYTVTIDNAVTGVTTGTAKARFQKWIKLNPEITGQVKSYGQMAILANNTRIQIKLVMEWTGDGEFHKFILTSNEDIKATL